MNPIYHNIDPFLLQLGDNFGIRWYSLPYMMGMLLTYLSLKKAAIRNELPGMTEEGAENFVLAAIISALIGARFFHVFVFEFNRYGFDPLAWIAVWRGGLAFHGGLLGITLAVIWFSHKHGTGIYQLLDRIAVPVAVALAFGRIANFINAEMYGKLYDGAFCVDYSQNQYMYNPPEGCRYPVQLYESAKNFGMAGLLFLLRERIRPVPGVITWTFVAFYGWVRFGLMYLRVEETVWRDLTLSQIFSGGMGVVGTIMLVVILAGGRSTDRNRK